MLLDLQVCRMTSISVDLNHVIYSSTTEPMRKQHLSQMLHDYFNAFSQVIQNAEIKMPFTFSEFENEFLDKKLFGFLFGLCKFILIKRIEGLRA